MKKESQKSQILNLLKEGYHLSKKQILKKTGCWNSGARVLELRNDGYAIKTTMVTNELTGNQFAVYNLIK